MQISRGTQHTQIQIPITNPDFPSPTRQACPHLPRLALTTTLARTHARRRCREATHRARRPPGERASSESDRSRLQRNPSQAALASNSAFCAGRARAWPPVSSLASPRCRSRRALRVPPPFRWLFPSLYGRRGTRREREMEHCCKPEGKRGPVHVARRLYSPDRNPTAASAAGARQVCDGARVAVRPASAAGGTGVRP